MIAITRQTRPTTVQLTEDTGAALANTAAATLFEAISLYITVYQNVPAI